MPLYVLTAIPVIVGHFSPDFASLNYSIRRLLISNKKYTNDIVYPSDSESDNVIHDTSQNNIMTLCVYRNTNSNFELSPPLVEISLYTHISVQYTLGLSLAAEEAQ